MPGMGIFNITKVQWNNDETQWPKSQLPFFLPDSNQISNGSEKWDWILNFKNKEENPRWETLRAMSLRLSKDRLREEQILCTPFWIYQVLFGLLDPFGIREHLYVTSRKFGYFLIPSALCHALMSNMPFCHKKAYSFFPWSHLC